MLVDAASPLEPPGIFVPTVSPAPGSIDAAGEQGVAPAVFGLLKGPPLPPVRLVVLAATDHSDTTEARGALARCAASHGCAVAKGPSGDREERPLMQIDRPDAVIAAVLQVAKESGTDISACQRL